MFCECAEDKLFRAKCGTPITAGAMGVDKLKEIGGIPILLLRFICILCPLNAYLRKLAGDSWLLPQAALLNNLILNDGEFLLENGEDLQYAFNLFYVPSAWIGLFAFEKKVSRAIFGGPPDDFCYVSIRTVSMGWINAVELIQKCIRIFLSRFVECPRISRFAAINPFQRLTLR